MKIAGYLGTFLLFAATSIPGCREKPQETVGRIIGAPTGSAARRTVPTSATATKKPGLVLSDADCRKAAACRDFGACTHEQGRCTVTSSEDCSRSIWCKRAGNCVAHNGSCRPGGTKNADCDKPHGTAGRNPCQLKGACTAKDGVCLAETNQDCGKSRQCTIQGRCTARNTVCVTASEQDCRKSQRCKIEKKCTFKHLDGGTGVCVGEEPKADGHQHGPGQQHRH